MFAVVCGIAGIVHFDNSEVRAEILAGMCSVQKHRGPDDSGAYVDGNVGLGFRRLSIIDLSAQGSQPMCNEDGSIWIVYNGEFYNFMEHRRELMKSGHKFKSKTDTEVIIHLYEEYGPDCLQKMNGMFAFAIYDKREKILFLARDRIGIKPLYYFIDNEKILFASEMKAVILHPAVPREIDDNALWQYFLLGYVPSPHSIFKNVKKLQPGHFMVIDLGKEEPQDASAPRSYWDVEYDPDYSKREEEWIEELRALIHDSVRLRTVSDVPLGAFLSGGIDSSTVVAFLSRISTERVKTFSIGFEEEDYSELKYARLIAKKFNTDHHELIVKPDAMNLLPMLAEQYDEPFADSSALPTYYVSRLARKHVTVALSGDGGDELFGGYNRYPYMRGLSKYLKMPTLVKKMFMKISDSLPEGTRGKGRLRLMGSDAPELYRQIIAQFKPHELKKIFAGSMEQVEDMLQPFFTDRAGLDLMTRLMWFDLKKYLPDDILTKVDKASMKNSLEVRVPVLDFRIVEFAARIPVEMKMKGVKTKYILKKAMEGILPQEILSDRKWGFAIPMEYWFKGQWKEYLNDSLFSSGNHVQDYLDMSYIKTLIHRQSDSGSDYSTKLWNVLFFEEWCKAYLDEPEVMKISTNGLNRINQ